MDYLISATELKDQQQAGNVLVFDCRFNLMDVDAGRAAYLQGHIPGAVYADLDQQLSSPHIPGETGRHPLPNKADWISQVKQWGITPQHKVVAYDDVGGVAASRLWWMLRWIGHDNTAVLNGGWQAWLENTGVSSTQAPEQQPESDYDYSALESLTRIIEVEDLDTSKQILIDAREQQRFDGTTEPIDPIAGHIPEAVCSPVSGNLDSNGKFKSASELSEKFSPALAADQSDVVCYCGSGVSAAHNILAMRVAGIEEPKLYVGSWSEWITDPSRPIATEAE